jgi:hypothetical protein
MPVNRPPLRQPVRVHRPAPRVPAARTAAPGAGTRARLTKRWHKEGRHGVVAAVIAAFLMGGLVIGYGVHVHFTQAAARMEARNLQMALAASEALSTGSVLFVPESGDMCRRRWIDNATWTLRDGGEIRCDEAATWSAENHLRKYQAGARIDAIRGVFQSRSADQVTR